MASNGPSNAPRGPRNFNPPSGSLPNGLAASRYATAAPTVQALAQRPAQAHPQATARPGAVLVQSADPTQGNRQAVTASVQSRAQFIRPPPAAVRRVATLVPGPAQVISHLPQASTIPSETETLKISLEQAESAKKTLEKQLDERETALKSAQKTQIDMAKMLGERKGEIDNAKWQIENLEMAKAELEREVAKKKLATTSSEGIAIQVASDKKELEDMMREREESARRAEKEIADAKAHTKTAEERTISAERRVIEAQGQVQTLKTELSSQRKLSKQAEGEVAWLRVELKQQVNLATQAQLDVLQLRNEVEAQKKLHAVAKDEASHLIVAVDELEASNRARTAQFAALEQEKQTMKAEITKLTKRFNDSLLAANAAKTEIEDQKSAVAIKFIASTESFAVVAQEQVEEIKTEEQEPIPVIICRTDYKTGRKISSLQRWLASLMVILTLIAILQPVLTAPAVKMFFRDQALTLNFFHQEQNQTTAKNESTRTFLPKVESTPEITATPDDYYGSNTVEDIGNVSGDTTSPA